MPVGFNEILNDEMFLEQFGLTSDFCIELLDLEKKETHYTKDFLFKKRGNGKREYYSIKGDSTEYDSLLDNILSELTDYYTPPYYVHGFVKHKGIRSNAMQHTGKEVVINMDISNFFSSINEARIISLLVSLGLNEKYAEYIASFCTIDGVLPTGFQTSPLLSNMIFIEIDQIVNDRCNENQCVYTRYADDLTISTNNNLIQSNIISFITKVLSDKGFILNHSKTRIRMKGGRQYVTGLDVSSGIPRLDKTIRRRLRLEMYYIKKYGFHSHFTKGKSRFFKDELSIYGWEKFIFSIDPSFYASLFI